MKALGVGVVKELDINIINGTLPYDILKYVVLLGEVVTVTLTIKRMNKYVFIFRVEYDNIFLVSCKDYVGEILDFSYLNTNKIVINLYSSMVDTIVDSANIKKVYIDKSRFYRINSDSLPNSIDTVYVNNIDTNFIVDKYNQVIYPQITTVIVTRELSDIVSPFWKYIFPSANIYMIK